MKNRVKHIHFVGIGGSGMCGIAEVLHNQGYTVSGSDQVQSAVTRHLASLGVQVYPGHSAEHVQGCGRGGYFHCSEKRQSRSNGGGGAADSRHSPRADAGGMMRFKDGIAIAGTHGKTTTTSLTASIFGRRGAGPHFRDRRQTHCGGHQCPFGQRQLHRCRGRRIRRIVPIPHAFDGGGNQYRRRPYGHLRPQR